MTETTIMRRATKMVRARFVLPLEMFLFAGMLIDAISGSWFIGGQLYRVLAAAGELPWWWLMLGPVGAMGFSVSAWEWFCGRGLPDRAIMCMSRLRFFLACLACCSCLYASYTLFISVPDGWRIVTVAFGNLLSLPFLGWIAAENRKVWLILDEKEPTTRLERHYAARRQSW